MPSRTCVGGGRTLTNPPATPHPCGGTTAVSGQTRSSDSQNIGVASIHLTGAQKGWGRGRSSCIGAGHRVRRYTPLSLCPSAAHAREGMAFLETLL